MSNLNSLKKSDLVALVEQLERNAEDDRRRIGVMMYEANVMTQRIVELEAEVDGTVDDADEIDRLTDIVKAQAARIKLLSQKVAAQPKAARPTQQPKRPVSAPVASPEAQEAMAMFLKLTPAQRSAVIKHSGFKVVNLGNILECQAKWHSRKSA